MRRSLHERSHQRAASRTRDRDQGRSHANGKAGVGLVGRSSRDNAGGCGLVGSNAKEPPDYSKKIKINIHHRIEHVPN